MTLVAANVAIAKIGSGPPPPVVLALSVAAPVVLAGTVARTRAWPEPTPERRVDHARVALRTPTDDDTTRLTDRSGRAIEITSHASCRPGARATARRLWTISALDED
jgi:hypothetical protein